MTQNLFPSLKEVLVSCLTDDLRRPEYQGDPNPLRGHCYVVHEAWHHLIGGPDREEVVVARVKHEGSTHWFHLIDGEVHDLTRGQFQTKPPYEDCVRTGFLTKKPSKRAAELMRRARERGWYEDAGW